MVATDDEYELLPHEELEELRKEVAKLKKNPLGEDKSATDLMSAVQDLSNAMNQLTHLLTQTNEEMLHEFRKTSLQENFSKISSQNEKIAEGILGVAHLIKSGVPAQPNTTIASQDSQNSTAQQQPNPPPSQSSPAPASPTTSIMPDPSSVVRDPFASAPPPPPPAPSGASSPPVRPNNPMSAFDSPSQQQAPPSQPAPSPNPAPTPQYSPAQQAPPQAPLPTLDGMPPPLDLKPATGVNIDPTTPDFEFPPPEEHPKKKGLMGMFK